MASFGAVGLVVGVVKAGGCFSKEGSDIFTIVSSVDEVLSELTGDSDKILGARILAVEPTQITVYGTFQYLSLIHI